MHAWSGGGANGGAGPDGLGPTVTRAASGSSSAGEAEAARAPPLKNGSDLRAAGYLIAVGSRTARFRRKHKSKLLLTVLLALVLLLFCLFILMTALYVRARRMRRPPLCESRECLRSAANLATSMDLTADPCDDFYQYVCGKWSEEHPRPDTLASYDWFRDKQSRVYALVRDALARNDSAPRPVQQARALFRACMDTETLDALGLAPAVRALEAAGLPPHPALDDGTDDVTDDVTFDWLAAAVAVKLRLGMDVLIGFDIFTDPRNSSIYRLVMGSPETVNPFPSMHNEKKRRSSRKNLRINSILDALDETFTRRGQRGRGRNGEEGEKGREGRRLKTSYVELMRVFVLEADGSWKNRSSELDTRLDKLAQLYYDLDCEIYELESDNSTMEEEGPEEQWFLDIPEYTAQELQALTDAVLKDNNVSSRPVLWRRYLEGVFSNSTVTLEDDDRILVSAPDRRYLEQLALLLANTPPRVVQLYMWIKVVEVLAPHTSSSVREIISRGRARGAGGEPEPPRALLCADAANDMLGMAVAAAIADPHFLNVTKPKVESMIHEIKNALAGLVGRAHWMDDDTKLATFRKIQRMRTLVGFPDWLLQDGALEQYYAGIQVEADTHLENLISIVQTKVRKVLDRFRSLNNYSWATDPTEVNAYHTFQENTITVPLVMLQYPFFDLGLDSLNYGSLGTILGHEITHGFDNFGRQFDADGNLVPWWSNATVQNFVQLTRCFVDQYSEYTLPTKHEHVDGARTLGENIADNGGVREALAALQHHRRTRRPEPRLPGFEHFTEDQLFFLSYGNLWCGEWTSHALSGELRDEHAPQRVRARGVLQNSATFAAAFHCRPGSPMNPHPHQRCVIF